MKIYVIFHCDIWKSYESMRFIGVATESKLRHVLRTIQKECKYSDEDMDNYIYIRETITNDTKEMDI